MTQAFSDLLYLFSCGALGIVPEKRISTDFSEIYKLSLEQGICPLIFCAAKKMYDDKRLDINAEAFNIFKKNVIAAVAINTKRMSFFHIVQKKLEQQGVPCCVLKGEALSYLYSNPDFRISSDTDLFIGVENMDKAVGILNGFDFNVRELYPNSHHIVATHPLAGTVELHLTLYDELFEDVWFDKKMLNREEYIKINADDGSDFQTLGITDGLIFVTLHYIKHFLCGGVGIRQLMDVLLYMKGHKKQIDWNRFNELTEHLKYKRFVENSVGIGVEYLNFNKADLPNFTCDDSLMLKILNDIENGGIFGQNEKERSGFYLKYTMARFKRFKNESYKIYMKKWRPSLRKLIFPSIKNFSYKYPYIEKKPYLYPFVWALRLFSLFVGLIKREKSIFKALNPETEKNDTVKKRMELIKELDMI